MVLTMPDSSSSPPGPSLEGRSVADLFEHLDRATSAHSSHSEAIDTVGDATHAALEAMRAAASQSPPEDRIEAYAAAQGAPAAAELPA